MLPLLPAGCGGGGDASSEADDAASSPPSIRAAVPDTALQGSFDWSTLDGAPAPAEFPPGAGVTLVTGTLDLQGAGAAARDGSGRFGLRFTMRSAAADSAETSGEEGRFRIVGDSLLFTPDGQEDRPPVRFRYEWRPDGTLALTDQQGHVWGYVRR